MKRTPLTVCPTCPWLLENHGKPHPAKWYSPANLRRLWSGLRTGKCPGVVCHSSDANNVEYGGDITNIKDGKQRPCAGAILVVMKHCNEFEQHGMFFYKLTHGRLAMSLQGLRFWIGQYVFNLMPPVEDRAADVGLPGERPIASKCVEGKPKRNKS